MKRMLLFSLFAVSAAGCFADYDDPHAADERAFRALEEPSDVPSSRDFRKVQSLTHAHLDVVLRHYFSPNGSRYGGLARDPEALQLLADYKVVLSGVRPESMNDPSERLAFWLNAYNAIAAEGVARLVERDGEGATIAADDFAVFTGEKHEIADFRITLEEIEHIVLRGDRLYPDVRDTPVALADQLMAQHRLVFPTGRLDARVNFAVSFGARSFPPMPSEAYQAPRLDEQLEARTKNFINDPNIGVNARGVSVLFDWFRRDFVETDGSVSAFIRRFLENPDDIFESERSLRHEWGVK